MYIFGYVLEKYGTLKICFWIFAIVDKFLIKNHWIFDNGFLNFTTMKFCSKKNSSWWLVEHKWVKVCNLILKGPLCVFFYINISTSCHMLLIQLIISFQSPSIIGILDPKIQTWKHVWLWNISYMQVWIEFMTFCKKHPEWFFFVFSKISHIGNLFMKQQEKKPKEWCFKGYIYTIFQIKNKEIWICI